MKIKTILPYLRCYRNCLLLDLACYTISEKGTLKPSSQIWVRLLALSISAYILITHG